MAIGIEARIAEALFEHAYLLESWPHLQKAFPNLGFTPRPDRPHLQAAILPAETTQAVGGKSLPRYLGVFQTTVVWPQGEGDIKPLDAAGRIAEHFKRGTRLRASGLTVHINIPPSVAPAFSDTPWRRWPISIRYQAFLNGADT